MSSTGDVSRGMLGKPPKDAEHHPLEFPSFDLLPISNSTTQGWPLFLRQLRWRHRAVLSEFFGTMLLMTLGLGVCAQVTLFGDGGGSAINVHLGWGLAVALAVYTTGGVSAHLNPAVTLTFAIYRGFPWSFVIPFWIAQVSGAFVASALVYCDYAERLSFVELLSGTARELDGETHTATAGMFATFPGEGVTLWGGFFDEAFTTALLLAFIFALDDQRNVAPKANLGPLLVGLVVAALCMSFASVSGLAMNPARDLGPRIFISFAGWGSGAFTADGGYWWVPVIGPFIGGPIGAFCYEFFVCVDVEEEIELQMALAAQTQVSQKLEDIRNSIPPSQNKSNAVEKKAEGNNDGVADCDGGEAYEWAPINAGNMASAMAAVAATDPQLPLHYRRPEIPEVVGISRRQSRAHAYNFGRAHPVRSRSQIFDLDSQQALATALRQSVSNSRSRERLRGGTWSVTPPQQATRISSLPPPHLPNRYSQSDGKLAETDKDGNHYGSMLNYMRSRTKQ